MNAVIVFTALCALLIIGKILRVQIPLFPLCMIGGVLLSVGAKVAPKIAVDTYVSIPAPGLDAAKLVENGGLARAWKYGRTDATTDRSTILVPIMEATKGDSLKFIPFAHMIPRVKRHLVL